MIYSPADVHLWLRCRRQWLRQAFPEGVNGPRSPLLPVEMTGEANLRETARVIADYLTRHQQSALDVYRQSIGDEKVPPIAMLPVVATEPLVAKRWADATEEVMRGRTEFVHGVLLAGSTAVLIDHGRYHSKVEAWELSIIRPSTGIRGMYYTEAALIARAADMQGYHLGGLHLHYLRKDVGLPETGETADLYCESNLLKRAQKGRQELDRELEALGRVATGSAAIDDEYRCSPRCELCNPGHHHRGDRYSVYTLHKGVHLARDLAADGVSDIREIPADFKGLSEKQTIQIRAVKDNMPHMNRELLSRFLDRLEYPYFFLDFEAFAPALPPFRGLASYEHTPVLASIHIQYAIDTEPVGQSFVAVPGKDQRGDFFRWIIETVGETGSIIVFSKPFESAMIKQLSRVAGMEGKGRDLQARMVDLLEPFSEFWIYHPEQRGKVSLKRILPVFTEGVGYHEETVKDGMHANLGYMRLTDRAIMDDVNRPPEVRVGAAAAEGVNLVLSRHTAATMAAFPGVNDILDYCAIDTIAMYHLVKRLKEISGHSKSL